MAPSAAAVGRDPLVRTTDRIEVHDSRRHIYAEQIHTRHTVTATVTDDNAAQQDSPINTITVTARWSVAAPNTPTKSRRHRQPKLVTPSRSGSTTTAGTNPDHPRRLGGGDGRTRDLDIRAGKTGFDTTVHGRGSAPGAGQLVAKMNGDQSVHRRVDSVTPATAHADNTFQKNVTIY